MPEIGQTAPDFELKNDEGHPVKLSDFRGKRVVLYFYPQDFTSGCELQACSFRDSYPDIEARNALVLGVSPDSVESHRKFREAKPTLETAIALGAQDSIAYYNLAVAVMGLVPADTGAAEIAPEKGAASAAAAISRPRMRAGITSAD